MKIGIFHPKRNIERIDSVMNSVILGFLEHEKDAEIEVIRTEKYVPCDVAIRWGISNEKPRTRYRAIIDEQHKGPLGIVELGWLGDRRDTYFQFGFGGISGNAKYYYPSKKIMYKRLQNLGLFFVNPTEVESGYILICGQVPWDTSVMHIDYRKWIKSMIVAISYFTDIPIRFRPHPLARNSVDLRKYPKVTISPPEATLAEDLTNAKCMVTYNSNSAVEALMYGVPTLTFHKGSMVYDITYHDFRDIHNLTFPSRGTILQRYAEIASSQWTREEFEKNIPWQIAKNQLELK